MTTTKIMEIAPSPQLQATIANLPKAKRTIEEFNAIVKRLPKDSTDNSVIINAPLSPFTPEEMAELVELTQEEKDLLSSTQSSRSKLTDDERAATDAYNKLTKEELEIISTIQQLEEAFLRRDEHNAAIIEDEKKQSLWECFKQTVVAYGVKTFMLDSVASLTLISVGIAAIVATLLFPGLTFLIGGVVFLAQVATLIIENTFHRRTLAKLSAHNPDEDVNIQIQGLRGVLETACTPEPIGGPRASPIDTQLTPQNPLQATRATLHLMKPT